MFKIIALTIIALLWQARLLGADIHEFDYTKNWQYCWVKLTAVEPGKIPSCSLEPVKRLQYLPSRIGYALVLSRKFNASSFQSPAIHIRIRASYEAFFAEELISSAGSVANDRVVLMGNYERLLSIPSGTKVGQLVLVVSSARLRTGVGRDLRVGEYEDIIAEIYRKSILEIVLAFLCIFIGITACCFIFADWRKYAYLWTSGVLLILDGTWIICYLDQNIRENFGLGGQWLDQLRYWVGFIWPAPVAVLLNLSRRKIIRISSWVMLGIIFVFCIFVAFEVYGFGEPIYYFNRYCKLVHLFVGISAMLLLFKESFDEKWLGRIAYASIILYCFFDSLNSLSFFFYKVLPTIIPHSFDISNVSFIRLYRESEAMKFNYVGILISSGGLIAVAIGRTFKNLRHRERLITDMKKVNNELKDARRDLIFSESFKQIARTTQMMAHDIRRPFAMIKSVLSMPNTCETFPPSIRKDIDRAIDHADSMVNDILLLSTPIVLQIAEHRLEKVIRDSLVEIFSFHHQAVSITYDLHTDQLLQIDGNKIQRALANLLLNAQRAMDQCDGVLSIRSRLIDDGSLDLRISNNGQSLTHNPELLFEPFTAPTGNGHGLGLSIVKKCIDVHQGMVSCLGTNQGETTFVIRLPAACVGGTAQSPIHAKFSSHDLHLGFQPREQSAFEPINNREISILLVDDEPLYLACLNSYVEKYRNSSNTIVAYSTQSYDEALTVMMNKSVDIAIVDLNLGTFEPKDNGIALSKLIRKKHPEAYICLHTNSLADIGRPSQQSGIDFFLAKPMNSHHFQELIYRVAER